MRGRIVLLVKFYLFWLVFFAIQKWLFMSTQYPLMGDIVIADWFRVVYHAFSLDFAVASYLVAGLGLIVVVSFFITPHLSVKIVKCYTFLLLFVALLIIISDLFTFPSWRFHIDKIVFFYMDNPKDVLACAQWWVWVGGFTAFGIVVIFLFYIFNRYMNWKEKTIFYFSYSRDRKKVIRAFLFLILTACLFIPIRGGITVSTNNSGQVYFSSNHMLNLAAINPVFNMFESLSIQAFDTQRYTYFSKEESSGLVRELFFKTNHPDTICFLNTRTPNVLLFIVESLSANPMEFCSRKNDITPNLNRYAKEGILFSNAYASSFRTDRGVVSVLSCFPGQPTSSLMLVPKKCTKLSYWTRDLLEAGYRLKFYYGGDENFARMRSYLINAGFKSRVCDKTFPIVQRLSKWGVHDHVLFNYLLNDIKSDSDFSSQRLDVVLTLSSHEPFDVPVHCWNEPYLNSLTYTDSCLGDFIEKFKQTPRWDSTLIVIVADHGFAWPKSLTNYDLGKYKIPILFLGGVLANHFEEKRTVSQIDIGTTLLTLMGMDQKCGQYPFAKNMLGNETPFAFFSFNDGFALVTDSGASVIDAKLNKTLYDSPPNEKRQRQAKAFMQKVYEEIEKL